MAGRSQAGKPRGLFVPGNVTMLPLEDPHASFVWRRPGAPEGRAVATGVTPTKRTQLALIRIFPVITRPTLSRKVQLEVGKLPEKPSSSQKP